jgi:hypothetical protein
LTEKASAPALEVPHATLFVPLLAQIASRATPFARRGGEECVTADPPGVDRGVWSAGVGEKSIIAGALEA